MDMIQQGAVGAIISTLIIVCATFVRNGIAARRLTNTTDLECVITELCKRDGNLVIINFYNPCKSLEIESLRQIISRPNHGNINEV